MPQMLQLSQGHWLNLDRIVEVRDQPMRLVVVLTPAYGDDTAGLVCLERHLLGAERERLLAWLTTHSAYGSVPRADNDEQEIPF